MRFAWLIFGVAATLMGVFASPSGAASGRTVLKVNMVRGFVTVYINGRQVGRYGKKSILDRSGGAIVTRDVSSLVKPGSNTLRAVWSEKVYPVGDVHISFAARSGPGTAFRELVGFNFGATSKAAGDKKASFNLPDAQGRLNSSTETAGSRGRRAQGSSRSHQTLLVANIARGDISVWINEHKIGNYPSGLVRLDVSNYVRGGSNTLRLAWTENVFPVGQISVAHAAQKNRFRTIAKYDLGVFTGKSSRGNRVTFALPATASQ